MIVLASASPRRRMLLSEIGLEFEVVPADVDEGFEGAPDPRDLALRLAERKALSVASRRGKDDWVLGADTVVALPAQAEGGAWTLMGKPSGTGEARAMLEALSASRHAVVTAVSVVAGGSKAPLSACETTWVTMRTLTPSEMSAYVASGEWEGKAGGYAIQETADAFVTGLEGGGFDNVVGLPVPLTLELLRLAGARPVADPGAGS